MHQALPALSEALPVPVLSPGRVGVRTAEMLLDLDLRHPVRPLGSIRAGPPGAVRARDEEGVSVRPCLRRLRERQGPRRRCRGSPRPGAARCAPRSSSASGPERRSSWRHAVMGRRRRDAIRSRVGRDGDARRRHGIRGRRIDAVCVDDASDPAVDALRSRLGIPVTGAGGASLWLGRLSGYQSHTSSRSRMCRRSNACSTDGRQDRIRPSVQAWRRRL